MIATRVAAAGLALLCATAAHAQAAREFCPDRPGLGTPACTIDRGRFAVELGLLDRTLDREAGDRVESFAAGDLLVRYGLADDLEVQVGWTAYGRVESRTGGIEETSEGTGDLLVAVRRNLAGNDGGDFAIAVMPYATLPTGSNPLGAGDWGAGLLVPMSYSLPHGLSAALTLEADAAVDGDGDGRHLAYSAIAGIDVPLGESLGATFELAASRDDDPAGTASPLVAGLSAGWTPNDDLQLDVGANIGLNRTADDLELYVGIARRF